MKQVHEHYKWGPGLIISETVPMTVLVHNFTVFGLEIKINLGIKTNVP